MRKDYGVFIGNKTSQKPVLLNSFNRNAYQNGPGIGELGVGRQF